MEATQKELRGLWYVFTGKSNAEIQMVDVCVFGPLQVPGLFYCSGKVV